MESNFMMPIGGKMILRSTGEENTMMCFFIG